LGRARRAKRAESRSAWREQVLERDDYICRLSAVEGVGVCEGRLHAHHVLPISRGGRDELGNGISACDFHHRLIHSRPEWAYAEGYLLRTPGRAQ
jgi:5-methylcytosine-specific restriction endonuclease McrA